MKKNPYQVRFSNYFLIVLTFFLLDACANMKINKVEEQLGIAKITVNDPNKSYFDVETRMESLKQVDKSDILFIMWNSYIPRQLKWQLYKYGCCPLNKPVPVI